MRLQSIDAIHKAVRSIALQKVAALRVYPPYLTSFHTHRWIHTLKQLHIMSRYDEPLVPFIPPDFIESPGQRDEDDEIEEEEEQEYIPNHTVRPNRLLELKSYRFRASRDQWKHISPQHIPADKPIPSSVRIITWNIDFTADKKQERLTAALRHIERDVLCCKPGHAPEPCCINLQEVHASVFSHLLRDDWVRRHFIATPITHSKWPENAYYGLVTLVSRSLTVVRAQILSFALSTQDRGGLAIYIKLRAPEPTHHIVTMCIVNTHLESLPQGEAWRPRQLSLLSRFLKQDSVRGGVIVGDMNAIGVSDATIAANCDLRDAWKKGDGDQTGFTWGYQGPDVGKFPPGRLDKVLYLPRKGYKVEEPRRIGLGVKDASETQWVSDHYGLDTYLRLTR
ncbi:Endonuclease/exonuclease/phosphatase [Crucibulum laeve]|uniref:Endonuclease/exonuclease/phosphatase n=1 Tax=Crucibulum laeve TaxID=68775 RepID=A0A5C3M4Y9_9AGAR|nr:Endonuclease/exonuclease/phosphatase [Crucibulum laeve]